MASTITSNMSRVHGGLDQPVHRIDLSADSKAGLQSIAVKDVDRTTLYRIADGTLSPLTGPMGVTDYESVLERKALERDGKLWAWTIPIILPVTDEEAAHCKPGTELALKDSKGQAFGFLQVSSCYEWDKERFLESVYGTVRQDHPGARMWLADPRQHLVGGNILLVPEAEEHPFQRRIMNPQQARALIESRGWEQTVAFQTRDALLRSQEYSLVFGAESILRATGKRTGAVLSPVMSELPEDQISPATRMLTYEALVENKVLGEGDLDTELWENKGQSLKENLGLVGVDMRLYYGGPAEAVMHAIYRQNLGFTHFIVDRKHADASYDDKAPIWGDFDAQQTFENLGGKLYIKTVNVGFSAYFEENGKVGLVSENQGNKAVSVPNDKVREQLIAGQSPDPRIMRESTSRILVGAYAKALGKSPGKAAKSRASKKSKGAKESK